MPSDLPVFRSRAQAFDDLVLDAVERLERLWARELANVDFLVEEVPPVPPMAETIPFSCLEHGPSGRARIVVYRRPVEIRTKGRDERALLVHEVVVEQVAELLGLTPETVDPRYGED